MDVDEYLKRIRYAGSLVPTAKTLRQLHLAHMFSVSFENLDIPLGCPIELSLPLIFDKVVRRQRGGFCYELNGLFGWLLEELGFSVVMLSARVFNDGKFGPEFDHMLLRVDVGEEFLADVGFGDSFLEPIRLRYGDEDRQFGASYLLAGSDAATELRCRKTGSWEPQYVFSQAPRQMSEFAAMCEYQQTSPESVFTQKAVCSLATPEGRMTLSNGRLIATLQGQREERPVASELEYRSLLKRHFGMELPDDTAIFRLLSMGA